MALDIEQSYDSAKSKIQAAQSYTDAKGKYDRITKKAGDSLEKANEDITKTLSQAKEQAEAYKQKIKNQFEQLLDVSTLTGGKGGNSIKYLKKTFIKVLRIIQPEINAILLDEMVNALGCDQQQTYTPTTFYISLKSIDLRSSLKIDPTSKVGKFFYEKPPIQVQINPFSMNRELYERIQSPNPYSVDNGQFYLGISGQPLFDIQYFDVNPLTGVPGGWYGVTLLNRADNINKVVSFLRDYFPTIKIVDLPTILGSIIDALCGAISIEADFGISQNQDTTTFSLYIQRILGLCFDNAREIDVSGISKLSELDNIDNSFFELTDLDLRQIESKVDNIMNGVVEFEECDNVKLPVNSAQLLDSIIQIIETEDVTQQEVLGDDLTTVLTSNPAWGGFQLNANIKAAVDLNFIKLICDGLIRALLSPKVLLPFITMFKAISTSTTGEVADIIKTIKDFCKVFKKLIINLISKIGAIFVRELFEIIKKDLFRLIQSIVTDLAKEKADARIIMILKLTQLLIVTIQFIRDWRRCRSVVDELLKLLTIATSGLNLEIPNPLLALSKFLDGYSSTRAFIGTIEEMQKMGIPTGDMPDGSPNLDMLSKYGQMKAQSNEQSENGKIQGISSPGKVYPNGTTQAVPVTGKAM